MIRTEADLEALYHRYKGGLYNAAFKFLPKRRKDDIQDVVNEALMALWQARDKVEYPPTYALSAARYSALQRTKRLSDKATHVPITNETKEIPSFHLNPEEQMLQAEEEESKEKRRERIIKRLSPTYQKHYKEWRKRGYKCTDDRQECKATHLRHRITALSKDYVQ